MKKIIGILTEDFRIYYELTRSLKEKKIEFASLSFSETIPSNIGIILTTNRELHKIDFANKIGVDIGINFAIHLAQKKLFGKEFYEELIIGIDPGIKPGIAFVGDGMVVQTVHAESPEDVLNIVEIGLVMYPAHSVIVRIGHGNPTIRNRIINVLIPLKLCVEIVNETRTSKHVKSDIDSAIKISFMKGTRAKKRYIINPTEGEVKDIQRLSRIESGGKITISKELAKKVAKGKLSLKDAMRKQNE